MPNVTPVEVNPTVNTSPTNDVSLATIRSLALIVGGYFVNRGYVTNDELMLIVSAALSVVVAASGVYSRYKLNKKLNTVASLPTSQINFK